MSSKIFNQIKTYCLIISLLFSGLNISSCAKNNYPASWSAIKRSAMNCPNLSGNYRDIAQNAPGTVGKPRRLSKLFLSIEDELSETITHIEIVQDTPEFFKVRAWNNRKLIKEKMFSKNESDFKCKAGMISLKKQGDSFAASAQVGVELVNFNFVKNENDELILKEEAFAMGFYVILPIAGGGSFWSRFAPIY